MANANMFAKCNGIEEVIGQAVGAGSMCWEKPELAGVFDDRQASRVVDDATARISEIMGEEQPIVVRSTPHPLGLPDDFKQEDSDA